MPSGLPETHQAGMAGNLNAQRTPGETKEGCRVLKPFLPAGCRAWARRAAMAALAAVAMVAMMVAVVEPAPRPDINLHAFWIYINILGTDWMPIRAR